MSSMSTEQTSPTFTWLGPDEPAAIALCHLCAQDPPLDRAAPNPGGARFAQLLDRQGGVVDEVVVTALGHNHWELACHGGAGIRAAVTAALCEHGYTESSTRSDPWQAWSQLYHPAAVRFLARSGQAQLPENIPWLHLAQRPIRILLTGPVNAGKSTLLNAWCGQQRAVASEQAGTTRDLLRAQVHVAGWCFEIIDSAGLRASTDALEQAGQALIAQARRSADVVLYCWPQDASGDPAAQEGDLLLRTKWDHNQLPAQGLVWHAPAFGDPDRSEALLQDLQSCICQHLLLPL